MSRKIHHASPDCQTVGELREFLAGISGDVKIVNTGYFGDIDGELYGAEYVEMREGAMGNGKLVNVVVLGGFPCSGEEPD